MQTQGEVELTIFTVEPETDGAPHGGYFVTLAEVGARNLRLILFRDDWPLAHWPPRPGDVLTFKVASLDWVRRPRKARQA